MNHNNAAASSRDAKLLNLVLGRVDAEKGVSPLPPPRYSALLLGSLIEASLINLNSPREELAQQLHVELDFVNALIDGELPEAEIRDGLLVEIANAIGYEPNLLRIMLDREIQPYTDPALLPEEPAQAEQFYFVIEPQEPVILQNESRPSGRRYYCRPGCPGHETYSAQCKPAPQPEVSLLRQYELDYEAAMTQPQPSEDSSLLLALEEVMAYNDDLQVMQAELRTEVQRLEHELNELRAAPKPVRKPAPTKPVQRRTFVATEHQGQFEREKEEPDKQLAQRLVSTAVNYT